MIHPGMYLSYKFKFKGALTWLVLVDDNTGCILCTYPAMPANVPIQILFRHYYVEATLRKYSLFVLADSGFSSCPRCVMNQNRRWEIETTFGRWKKHFLAFDHCLGEAVWHDCIAQVTSFLMNVKLVDLPVTKRRYPKIHAMDLILQDVHRQL